MQGQKAKSFCSHNVLTNVRTKNLGSFLPPWYYGILLSSLLQGDTSTVQCQRRPRTASTSLERGTQYSSNPNLLSKKQKHRFHFQYNRKLRLEIHQKSLVPKIS